MEHKTISVIKSAILGFFDDEAYVSKKVLEVGVAVRVNDAPITHIHKIFGVKRSIGVKRLLHYFPEINIPKSNIISDLSDLLRRLGIKHKVSPTHFNINKGSLSVTWKIIIYGEINLRRVAELGLFSPLSSKLRNFPHT
ncbi:MAG: LAGLIDADG family homing endonuclease [Thermoproteota archaeon]